MSGLMAEEATRWTLKGTVLIACNCDYGCPCNFNALPSKGFCEGGWAWCVDEGRFGDTALDGLNFGPQGRHAYFVHSYQLNPAQRADLLADTEYGGAVTAIVARDNIFGTQFHPEKSQKLGLALIANFLQWNP